MNIRTIVNTITHKPIRSGSEDETGKAVQLGMKGSTAVSRLGERGGRRNGLVSLRSCFDLHGSSTFSERGEIFMLPCGRGRAVLSILTLFLLCTFACQSAQAKKLRGDVVTMKNGDRLTGEVKGLEQGVLYVETDYFSGSIGVDWHQVQKVESAATYQIVLSSGKRLTGTISKVEAEAAPDKDFKVHTPGLDVATSSANIVQIESQKPTFWRQLTGSIDFGANFTSGNNSISLSTSARATYLASHWKAEASYTGSYTGQTGGTTSNTLETQFLGERFLNRNSYLVGLSDFLHSSQQDLQLRTTLGGGYGRFLVHTNHNLFRWVIGLDYSQASYQSGMAQPTQKTSEFLIGAQYQLFHFDRFSLQSQTFFFPGLSDFGRIRLVTNDIFTVKLSNNFHSNISFWDNFDSRPPLGARNNATGLSAGLGWTF
jgi:putative salt-induced outer membrane protein YdiY